MIQARPKLPIYRFSQNGFLCAFTQNDRIVTKDGNTRVYSERNYLSFLFLSSDLPNNPTTGRWYEISNP